MPKSFSEVEFEILRVLLDRGALFPMDIVNASTRVKRGSVYVYLGRLQKKKWVRASQSEIVCPAGTSMRKYDVTGIGASRYRTHVADNQWAL